MEEFKHLTKEQLLNLIERQYKIFTQRGKRKMVAEIQAEKMLNYAQYHKK